MQSILFLGAVGIVGAAPDSAIQGGKTTPAPAPGTSKGHAVAATQAQNQSQSQKIDLPIPVGEPVKGIKIPQYDENGKLTMNLIADTARKLDEKQVEFGKLKIEFNDKEEKTISVEIPHSILDMESKKLVADTETLIHRETSRSLDKALSLTPSRDLALSRGVSTPPSEMGKRPIYHELPNEPSRSFIPYHPDDRDDGFLPVGFGAGAGSGTNRWRTICATRRPCRWAHGRNGPLGNSRE